MPSGKAHWRLCTGRWGVRRMGASGKKKGKSESEIYDLENRKSLTLDRANRGVCGEPHRVDAARDLLHPNYAQCVAHT